MNSDMELRFLLNALTKWATREPVSHVDFERIIHLMRTTPIQISHLQEDEMAALKAKWLTALQELISQ
jgi:hypothetical protein